MSEKVKKRNRRFKADKHPELSAFTISKDNINDFLSDITRKKKEKDEVIDIIVIDLFCGAGGTTCGFAQLPYCKVIACVNHDFYAIKSHHLNNPDVAHFEEDIRLLDLTLLKDILDHYRHLYPLAKLILWASLECTNFSKAKGGASRDADSRTLANHLFRYIEVLQPEYIMIENVVEFMSWGPMKIKVKKKHDTHWELKTQPNDETGEFEYCWEPISTRNGEDWLKWRGMVKEYGYRDDWQELNSANFGSYTSRNRLFGIFAKGNLPIAWPEATHAKVPGIGSLFGPLKPWMPVRDVLDFSDQGQSIFDRKYNLNLRKQDRKELVEPTLERVYAGLIKFVAGGKEAFMIKYNSMGKNGNYAPPSVDQPCPVVCTQNRLGIVQASFIAQRNSGDPDGRVISIDNPARTLTSTAGNQDLVNVSYIAKYYSGKPEGKVISTDGPAGTICCADTQALVQPEFLASYYGNGDNVGSIESPCPTIPTKDRISIVKPLFLDKQYSSGDNTIGLDQPAGTIMQNDKHALVTTKHFIDRNFTNGGQNQSVDDPAGSLLQVPKMNLVSAEPFVVNTNYTNNPTSINQPAPTITANRKWQYIVNPSWFGNPSSTELPCPVIIARQDKAPLYLVQTELGEYGIVIYDSDSEMTRKIKEFMALYGIIDIKMRMLKIPELLKIQGFPDGYKLCGSQTDRKKFIGNSVEPNVARNMGAALHQALQAYKIKQKCKIAI